MSEQKKGTEILEIELPNGELIEMEVPSGASPEAIRAAVNKMRGLPSATGPVAPTPVPKGLQIAPQPQAQGQGALRRLAGGLFLDPLIGLKDLGLKQVAEKMPTPMDAANPINALRVGGGMLHDITQGMVTSQMEAGQEWLDRGGEGGALGDVSRFVEAAVPIFGPASRSIRKRFEKGDVAGGIGETGGMLLSMVAPEASSLRGAASAKLAVGNLPNRLMKALRPIKTQREAFLKTAPLEIDRIIASGEQVGNVRDLIDVSRKHRLETGKQIDTVLQANNQPLSSRQLADEMRKSIDDFAEVIDPSGVKAVRKMASDFETKFQNLTLEQAEGFRQRLNTELGLFFRKNKAMQREAISDPQVAGKLAMREAIETVIESKLSHSSLKKLRGQYAAARKMEDAAHSRMLDDLVKEDPALLNFDSLDTVTAGSAIAAALSGQGSLALGLAKTVAARRAITVLEKMSKTTDARIAAAFRKSRNLGPSDSSQAAQFLMPALIGLDEDLKLEGKKKP